MLSQKIKNIIQNFQQKQGYRKWLNRGKPIPAPDIVKQLTVKSYATRFRIHTFVETGTYLGAMTLAVKDLFTMIYSIELSPELYEKAKIKFSKYHHISILKGDSSIVLPEILNNIGDPCLFWFDAHYSGGHTARGEKDTPILDEMKYVFHHAIDDHVILIDDARLFTGENGYPTLKELKDMVLNRYDDHILEVKDDIIRVCKK